MAGLAGLNRRAVGGLLLALTACGSASSSGLSVPAVPSQPGASSVSSSSSPPSMDSAEPHVLLVGDSLAVEAEQYLGALLDARLTTVALGFTAPCDFVGADLPLADADVVVLSFNGNAFTPCTDGSALVEQYRADLLRLVERARLAGAEVVLVDQPRRRDDGAANTATNAVIVAIDEMFREFASEFDGVTVAPAGAAVEADDGTFVLRMACLPDEPSCDPDGTNVVRNDDGVHFCPSVAPWDGSCAVHSSGAYRFAKVIAASVRERLGLD